uniref:Axonemal dynein light intermediate polypeptide 1 n=1 Tax=Oryzias latipes TaxID=8090 RepID=H2MI52_ORYLA
MTSFGESLLKYDNPILVKTKGDKKSQKGRTLTLSNLPAPSFAAGVPSPPTQNLDENILHAILPPREWTEGDQQWVQKVSTAITTRKDVIHLQEQLNIKLKQKKAKPTGICPIRWVLFSQCFGKTAEGRDKAHLRVKMWIVMKYKCIMHLISFLR